MKYPIYEFAGADFDETLSTMMFVSTLTNAFSLHRRGSLARVLFPGIFDVDMRDTLDVFNRAAGRHCDAFILAGHHEQAVQLEQVSEESLWRIFPQAFAIKSQIMAVDAPGQATWVSEQCADLESIRVVYLYVLAFHLPRAYLTQLKALIRAGLDRRVLLLPRVLSGNPMQVRPLTRPWEDDAVSQVQLIPGEAWRIFNYTKKGDLASLEDVKRHLAFHSLRLRWH